MVGLWYRRKLRGTREASNGGRVRVRIIHGLNISHKELTYLLQKSKSHRNKVITHKYRGSQQFSRVEYSTQIYRFDTGEAKEYLKVLAAELSIQPHLEINYLQQGDQ